MCGICGVVGSSDERLVTRMLDAIRHRGPNSFDVRATSRACLGGCRLTIVGERTAPLPVHDRETDSLVLLNGEIYNYRDVGDDLGIELGPEVADPEAAVLAAVLDRFGPIGLDRLKGMFAFAVLRGDRLTLGRDRLGIKPMFYARIGTEIAFGSEIKAILRHPGSSVVLDPEALDEIAVFGYVTSPTRTPFAHIRQVAPGSVVSFENGEECSMSYWTPRPAFLAGSDPDIEEAAADVLETTRVSLGSVLSHDRHPKTFYLSGGVDSSLLVALASDLVGGPVRTFTLADADDSPDLIAARQVAAAVDSEHHEIRVDLDGYLRELPVFVRHYENLMAGGVFDIHGGIAFQILSRAIGEQERVACSGEGADELFGGYYWTYTHPLGFADRMRERLNHLGYPPGVAAQVEALFPVPEDAVTYQRSLFDFLVGSGLTNNHLWSVDRSCGAFGFEVRPPYLHDDVVDVALSLPIELKASRSETKRVLKAAARPTFRRLGIESCLDRLKEGMPAAVRNLAVRVDALVRDLVPPRHLETHPYRRYLDTPLDCLLFDLFCYVLVVNRGDLPTGFEALTFYKDGTGANLYR